MCMYKPSIVGELCVHMLPCCDHIISGTVLSFLGSRAAGVWRWPLSSINCLLPFSYTTQITWILLTVI